MARAVFYAEIGGKLRKRTILIPYKLVVLSDIVDKLSEYEIFDDDNIEQCPFLVCYHNLAFECNKIGTEVFKLPRDEYWAEFINLTEREEDEEICFAVNLVKSKID